MLCFNATFIISLKISELKTISRTILNHPHLFSVFSQVIWSLGTNHLEWDVYVMHQMKTLYWNVCNLWLLWAASLVIGMGIFHSHTVQFCPP